MGVSLHNSNNVIIAKRKQIRAKYLSKKASRKASEPKDILRGRLPSNKKLKKIAQRKKLPHSKFQTKNERAFAELAKAPGKESVDSNESDKMED